MKKIGVITIVLLLYALEAFAVTLPDCSPQPACLATEPPTNLQVQVVYDDCPTANPKFFLTWDAPVDTGVPIRAYSVQKNVSGTWDSTAWTAGPEFGEVTEWLDKYVNIGMTVQYRIKTLSVYSILSEPSSEVTVTLPGCGTTTTTTLPPTCEEQLDGCESKLDELFDSILEYLFP